VILGCIAAIVGSVIQSASFSVAQLIVGRICTVCWRIPRYKFDKADRYRDLRLDVSQGSYRWSQGIVKKLFTVQQCGSYILDGNGYGNW
jgi:hypothetical protein